MKGILEAIRQNWRDEDPAHAGYVAIRIWREATQAIWWENRERLGDMVASLETAEIRSGDAEAAYTGVTVLVDVGYLARKAAEEMTG